MSSWLHTHTPTLATLEGRGLVVRRVAYHRAGTVDQAQARVTARRYDLHGRPTASWDPRLFARLSNGEGDTPNQSSVFSLSGMPLETCSVDAGWRVSLFGVAGHVLESWDSRDSHWQTDYDELLRPVVLREKSGAHPVRVAGRLDYAAVTAEDAAHNRCGRLLRHDDSAGSQRLTDYALNGQVSSETRHYLAALDPPDWPDALTECDALLEPGPGATSRMRYGPTGDVQEQTDALGNVRTLHYGIAGTLDELKLSLDGGNPQTVLSAMRYNALGQVEAQTVGNGVISLADYDSADGRLLRMRASRAGRARLQDLVYTYDPAGNPLSIEDLSQPIRYFANQRVEARNEYHYDSLYQLIEASGREALGALIGPGLPELGLTPGDTSQLLNYRQYFQYDASGNLQQLRHVGRQSYTRRMVVSDTSNRALPWPDGSASPDPDTGFDANGNLQVLQPGQPLHWNALNQLCSTRQVVRAQANNDQEQYIYNSSGARVRKVTTRQARLLVHSSEVRYLPGLEIRSDGATGERLAVVTVQAGGCSLRCLHWSEGKPDGIANDQHRYSLDDHQGSSTLELDAEANLLSHEGYYPFGGTAWWAARSALEARYKTIRYSGKERDASGLYYYGFRYYAPWLQRWINPDPAGDVDGLNRFCMVGNSPVRRVDVQGLLADDVLDKLKYSDLETLVALIVFFGSLMMFWMRRGRQPEQRREVPGLPGPPDETTSPVNEFLSGATSTFNLNSGEIRRLERFTVSENKKRSTFESPQMHEDTEGNLIATFLNDTAGASAETQISSVAIRQGRVRTVSDASNSTVSLFETDTSGIGTAKANKKVKPDSGSPGSSNSTSFATRRRTRTASESHVDVEFFKSAGFLRLDESVQDSIRNTITEFQERGKQAKHFHKLSNGQFSLDVHVDGWTGRGAWRALLNKVPGGFKLTSVANTHK